MCLNKEQLRRDLAEFIGTFFIVFAGCASISIGLPAATIAIVFGLAVSCMIYAVGHISGAHFNPAVTLGFAVSRHFPLKQVINYWLAQFLGAGLAIFALTQLLPKTHILGATVFHVSTAQALGWEITLTFLLMFVIMATATDTRAVGTMAGVAIGGAVALDAFIGGPMTGASMNPARSLAPALFQGTLESLWVYFAGPMAGAVLAALLYEWIRGESRSNTQ